MNEIYEWTISGSKPIIGLESKLDEYRADGKKIVTANGCFDIFHFGHLSLLMGAKSLGDIVIVGVNSDRAVTKIKGTGRPLFPEQERASLLISLAYVDHVIVFDDILPNEFLEMVRPDIHCISGEYANKKLPEKEIVEKSGGEVKVLPYIPEHSTTDIIQRINQHKTDPDSHTSSGTGKDAITDYLFESSTSIRCLAYQHGEALIRIARQMLDVIKSNGKIIIYGSGGGGADAQSFAAELIRRFTPRGKAFPAMALSNGQDGDFSQQLEAAGNPEDLLFLILPGKPSKDMITAMQTAGEIGMKVVAFTGNEESPLHDLCDEILSVDSTNVSIIQQGFIAAFHGICNLLGDEPLFKSSQM